MLKKITRNSEFVLDVLFAEGAISQARIAEVKEEAEKTKKSLTDVLVEKKIVSEELLAKSLSKALNIPFIDLSKEDFSREALQFISPETAKNYLAFPFSVGEKLLKIAIADLQHIESVDPNFFEKIRSSSGKTIGLYIATISDIRHALRYYHKEQGTKMVKAANINSDSQKSKSVLDVLVSQGLIDGNQSDKIRTEAIEKRTRPEDLIVQKGIVSEEDLAKAYSNLFGYPFVRLDKVDIPYEIIAKFPEEISKKYRIVAFDMLGPRVIKVAMADPYDPKVIELLNYIEDKNELELDRFIALDFDIEKALEQYVSPVEKPLPQKQAPTKQPPPAKAGTAPKQADEEERETDFGQASVAENDIGRLLKHDIKNLGELEDIVKEASIPKIVAGIINFALTRRASDIHVQPSKKSLRIRYRIDGVLNDVIDIPMQLHPAIISRIKILSKLRIDEKRIPQDGRFEVVFGKKAVDIRVSTLPTTHGEKVVLRLLDTSSGLFTLDDLGLRGRAFKEFTKSIVKPFGMIIACGPTGSGKTTTLYAALNYINKPGVNIVTLEDPVEYDVKGINQSQAKPDIGYTFAEGLRSILRQDPDIIMVGEIRDKETAGMAIHSALTGHLVFSSLHTNDASGALPRLVDMGIEPFLIISAVNIFIAQRLVRKICPYCKKAAKLPPTLLERLEHEIKHLPSEILKKFKRPYKFYQGAGCNKCNEGYFGRLGIFEVLPMSDKIEKMTMASPTAAMIQKTAREEGMITMKQDGLIKALEGITTVDEVLRVTIS